MKSLDKLITFIVILILLIIVMVGVLYASVILFKLPIDLPFKPSGFAPLQVQQTTLDNSSSWKDAKVYIPSEKYTTVEDIIQDEEVKPADMSDNELMKMFPMLDKTTLQNYLSNNPECLINGYGKLLIDDADLANTPTGIKTVNGDDVLSIDALDGILIIGRDIVSSSGTSKVKLAIVNNMKQIDMTLVSDLSYWDVIETHAKNNGAILSVNASGYNWNETGAYASTYGAIKFHSNMYRKAVNNNYLINFDTNGLMSIGSDITTAYNSVETSVVLIQGGVDKIVDTSTQVVTENTANTQVSTEPIPTDTPVEIRCAQSAIGQTKEGVTLLIVASGGTYGSNLGATDSEILSIMKQYKAYNAAMLSGGSRAIMYWNGRIINETVNYPAEGVRLPNTIIIKPSVAVVK